MLRSAMGVSVCWRITPHWGVERWARKTRSQKSADGQSRTFVRHVAFRVGNMPQTVPIAERAEGRVWKSLSPVGRAEGTKGFGSVAAPLLAGFSLTAVVLLLSLERRPPLAGPALALLSGATVLLVMATQFALTAVRYAISPAERLEWTPEATVDARTLDLEREAQSVERDLFERIDRRAGILYDLGILSLLLGLFLVLWPSKVDVWRLVALAVVAIAELAEILWVNPWWTPNWFLPNREGIEPGSKVDPLTETGERAIMGGKSGG